jgi:drug/metabolite transporter (DMT)-like permease
MLTRSTLFAFIVAAVGWGTGGIATRAAFGEGVEGWTLVSMRVAIAAVFVVALFAVRGIRRIDQTSWRVGSMMAVLNLTFPYVVFTFAYAHASAGFVGLFAALIPLVTAIYAHFMLDDEPFTREKLLGLSLGFAGVLVLLALGDTGLGAEGNPWLAAGLSIAGVATIGYAGAYARRYAGRYDATQVTGVQITLGAVMLLPLMLLFDGLPNDLSPTGWALITYMALASTFIPFLIFYVLLRTISATSVSLIGYLVPLVALVGGILLLGEQLEPGIAIGGLLIFTGMLLTDRAGRVAHRKAALAADVEPPHHLAAGES